MSFKHKSRAKREKEFKKLCKAVYIIVELFNKIHKIEEKYYPKLEPGGTVYVKVGEKYTLNFDGSKSDPEYLNKMEKLFNESETIINNFISE